MVAMENMNAKTMTRSSKPTTRMASQRHRVLIYTTCYNVLDGVTFTIRKLEHELLSAGHDVCILTTKSGNEANTDLVGSHPNRQVIFMDNAFPIPFLHDPNRPEQTYQIGFSISSSVRQQLDDFEPSIIHVTVTDCTSLHLIQYARSKEIPLMGTFHSNIPEYMDHYPGLSWLKIILAANFRHQYNFLQALYVPTPYIQRHLMNTYHMDDVTSLQVWGRGVDVEQFSPAHRSQKFRQSIGVDDDVCVVLWVGRLVPEKRPDIFASTVRRLHKLGLNFRALVVGAGPCEKEITELPNTVFMEWMNADQLAVAYASSDVFLFPSAVETFGNVTLEAAASGLPVVVESCCSGHLVLEGQNGYLVEAGDEDNFFESTRKLVADRQLREEFGFCGRKMALSLEKSLVVRQMLDNYCKVTNEFYTEYGGHHHNRDSVYEKPGSFSFGHYPRPIILDVVETFFIVIFRVMWNMAVMSSWLVNKMSVDQTGTPNKSEASSSTKNLLSVGGVSKANNNKFVSETTKILPETSIVLDNNCSTVELVDIEIANVSTASETDEEDEESDKISLQKKETKSQSHGSQPSKSEDWKLTHTLATLFIKTVQMQILAENYIRDALSSRSPQARQCVQAKRKNSNFAYNPADTALLSGSRIRSSDLISTLTPITDASHSPVTSTNIIRDNRVMRRNQIAIPDSF